MMTYFMKNTIVGEIVNGLTFCSAKRSFREDIFFKLKIVMIPVASGRQKVA